MPPIERHPWILNINDWAALPLLMRTSITVANESPLSQSVSVMRIEVNGFSLAPIGNTVLSEGWLTTPFDH